MLPIGQNSNTSFWDHPDGGKMDHPSTSAIISLCVRFSCPIKVKANEDINGNFIVS